MKIRYAGTGFPASFSSLNTALVDDLDGCAWWHFAWAAVTVGKKTGASPIAPIETLWRTALVLAALRGTGTGYVRASALYRGLERTEKGTVSFYVGMAMCKLLACVKLNVTFLRHMSQFSHGDHYSPDFVGRIDGAWLTGPPAGYGKWVLIESKGRAVYRPEATADAKAAANAALAPALTYYGLPLTVGPTIGSQTHFGKSHKTRMAVRWDDPPSEKLEADKNSIDLTDGTLLHGYYEPVMDLLNNFGVRHDSRRVRDIEYRVTSLPGLRLSVGVPEMLRAEFAGLPQRFPESAGSHGAWRARLRELGIASRPIGPSGKDDAATDTPNGGVGPDGLLIELHKDFLSETGP